MYTQALRLQRSEVFCLFGSRDYVERNEFLSLVSGDLNCMRLENVGEEMRDEMRDEDKDRKRMIVVTPSLSVDEIVTLIQERADVLEVRSVLSLFFSPLLFFFFVDLIPSRFNQI